MANLEGWLYRKKITVTGSTDGAQTDYTIPITVNFGSGTDSGSNVYCASHCAVDFDDIRFTAADGTTLLSHWLDAKTDSNNAVFWVKIPSIGASPATLDMYVYYGNSTASQSSNLASAFPLGVDFETPIHEIAQHANSRLEIPCYTGTPAFQAVHPSVVDMGESGWNGHRYWMVFTPYPNSDSSKENPSIVVSSDKINWSVPSGLTNPIVPYPGTGMYNADPELVYNDDTAELWVYFKFNRSSPEQNYILCVKSDDGVSWTDLDGGAITTSNLGTLIIDSGTSWEGCPCVVKQGDSWKMWTWVEANALVMHTSADGRTWGAPTTCTRNYDVVSTTMWHMGIAYSSTLGKYICITTNDQTGTVMYYMESSDGLTWYAGKVNIFDKRWGEWDVNLYRPTFCINADDTVDIWYSAYTSAYIWGTGHTSTTVSKLAGTRNTDAGWTIPNLRTVISAKTWPFGKRGARSLKIMGIGPLDMQKASPVASKFSYSIDYYDDGLSNRMNVARIKNATVAVGVGVHTVASSSYYVYHNTAGAYTATTVQRSVGWHKFEFQVDASYNVKIYIDDINVATISSAFASSVLYTYISTYTSTNNQYPAYWDDLRVRKLAANEPVITEFATEEYFPDDEVPPIISSLSAVATGATTATLTVTTDEGNGSIFFLLDANATATESAILAGLSQSVTATGEQEIDVTALDHNTTYYAHVLHQDAAGNPSNILHSEPFRTLDLSITLDFPDTAPCSLLGYQVWSKLTVTDEEIAALWSE